MSKNNNFVKEKIERSSIKGKASEKVIICSGKPKSKKDSIHFGVEFLRKYNSWGFYNIKESLDYFALYVTKPISKIKYFAEIENIIDPADEESIVENYEEYPNYGKGKKLIILKNIKKLKDPIICKKFGIQSIKYVSLKEFKEAETTLDLYGWVSSSDSNSIDTK